MDFVIEILLEMYMELMLLAIPEEKRGKKHYIFATIIAVILTLGVMALAIWGVSLLVENRNTWGWLPLCIAIIASILQITLGIILSIKKHKNK